jgi:hypothetical protein
VALSQYRPRHHLEEPIAFNAQIENFLRAVERGSWRRGLNRSLRVFLPFVFGYYSGFPKRPADLAPEVCGLGSMTATPASSHARISSLLK